MPPWLITGVRWASMVICAVVWALLWWQPSSRALLAWVSPGWALYLVAMGGVLLGVGMSNWHAQPTRQRKKTADDIYAYFSFILCAFALWWFIKYFHVILHTRIPALQADDLRFALTMTYVFGSSLGNALPMLRRLYEQRIALRTPSPTSDMEQPED